MFLLRPPTLPLPSLPVFSLPLSFPRHLAPQLQYCKNIRVVLTLLKMPQLRLSLKLYCDRELNERHTRNVTSKHLQSQRGKINQAGSGFLGINTAIGMITTYWRHWATTVVITAWLPFTVKWHSTFFVEGENRLHVVVQGVRYGDGWQHTYNGRQCQHQSHHHTSKVHSRDGIENNLTKVLGCWQMFDYCHLGIIVLDVTSTNISYVIQFLPFPHCLAEDFHHNHKINAWCTKVNFNNSTLNIVHLHINCIAFCLSSM